LADDPLLPEVLLAWGEAEIDGESVSIEELCGRSPELITAAHRRIDHLVAMDSLLAPWPPCDATVVRDGVQNDDSPAPETDWKALGYDIVRVLGCGGMGIVYLARHVRLDRLVALKTIPSWMQMTATARGRFDFEARAVARLSHPNIVRIHDIGNVAGRPYLTFEFAEAGNLSTAIHARTPEPREAARITEVLARAVAYAHEQGILHRDLKPTNILVCRPSDSVSGVLDADSLKIADFGLARLLDNSANVTRSGTLLGTPGYMSPEQAQGRNDLIGPATDVYGLGIVLFEVLCGRPPFQAETEWAALHQVVTMAPPTVRSLRADCPPALEAICLKCLEKSPADRYESAASLADDLARFLSGTQTTGEVEGRFTRRALLATAVLGGAGGAAAALWLMRRTPPIRVGILQSQTGTMGEGGRSVVEACLLAIREINAKGGLLGRQIEPLVVDGESDEDVFGREAARMMAENEACVIFGGIISAHCRAIEPSVRKFARLLFYPGDSEGISRMPNVVRLGAFPNQNILPAVDWARASLGKHRIFFVGSDSIYPRVLGAFLADSTTKLGVKLIGEVYIPWSDMLACVVDLVHTIEAEKPHLILNALYGTANWAFIQQLRAVARLSAESVPCISFCLSGQEIRNVWREMVGDYVCGHYLQSLKSPANDRFLERLQGDTNTDRDPVLVSDATEASYVGVHLWAKAVALAGNADNLDAVKDALGKTSFEGPSGIVRLDPQALNTSRHVRVGRVRLDHTIDQIWSSVEPLSPISCPPTRSEAQWETLIQGLRARWKGHWSNFAVRPPGSG
jgi:urea transport system substrate-binding protein